MILVCTRMKPAILLSFELKHCVEHVYFKLCQNTYMVSEKFKQFVTYLRQNSIINKCDAANMIV